MSGRGWIGVDLDGTLAHYVKWEGHESIGPPVPLMANRVKRWLAEGRDVRIFTARVSDPDPAVLLAIHKWCAINLGTALPVTNVKDFQMVELWDDRAVTVECNTGRKLAKSSRGLR